MNTTTIRPSLKPRLRQAFFAELFAVLLAALFGVLSSPAALAGDVYYSLPVTSLTLTEGKLPVGPTAAPWQRWQMLTSLPDSVALDGPGEAYVSINKGLDDSSVAPVKTLSVRAPENQSISGRIFFRSNDLSGVVQVRFKISPDTASSEARAAFLSAKEQYYNGLLGQNIAGAAWFRHQLQLVARERGTNLALPNDPRRNWNRSRPSEFEDTFELFSGGRALSENLQLDRAMALRNSTNADIALTNLSGITVPAMDWKAQVTNSFIELDPLARFIPADQHALFFPSFPALVAMTDEAEASGTPILQLFEPRSEDAGTRDHYQTQLCLGLSDLSRLLGPQVVDSAAFTGSDPYLRVGTDVGVLFESPNPTLLQAHIAARQATALKAHPAAQAVSGDIAGVHFVGVTTPDRVICSYMAAVSNVVYVTNSRQQLETLIRTAQGRLPALSTQDEYRFFRQRYLRGDKSETAFLVLSDATIRRWCSPQWRIADSRRTRAAAVLSELQAAHLDELVRGDTRGVVLHSDYPSPELGRLDLTPDGVTSSIYGSLAFMTPISEMPLATVTSSEAAAYARWRDSYQNNWSQFFDPIAVRFSVSPARLATSLTVMPLILNSQYNTLSAIATGAKIAPDAGDPHAGALARLALAVNNQSPPVKEAGNFVGNLAPGMKANFLSWLGQSVCLYADDDPFWNELTAATNSDNFLDQSYSRLPVGIYFEVKNALGAAVFLTSLHAFADQSAPQMMVWENLEYHGRPYVKIAPSKTSREADHFDNWVVYYAITPDSLTVTLSEALLKRALDRQAAHAGTNAPPAASPEPWLGGSLGLQLQKKFADVLLKVTEDEYQKHLQQLAWNNLPILNEWKRLYPGQDPVKLHEKFFGVKLVCPGGGTYVWNETWHTMESTVFGHPGQPKTGPATLFPGLTNVNLGLTFENQGLSAQGILERSAAR